jgi:hypothetical protein
MTTTKILVALAALAAPLARTDNVPSPPIISFSDNDRLTLKEVTEGTVVFGEIGAGKSSPSKLTSAGSASTCGSGTRAALTRFGAARAQVRRPESI